MSLFLKVGKVLRKRSMAGIAATVAAMMLLMEGPCVLADELTMLTDGNVRKEASTSSDKVASASNGSTYTIEGETTGSDGNTWYQITINGNTGYVREDLVKVSSGGGNDDSSSSSVLSSSAAVIEVKTDTTNVRSGASTGDSVVTQASSGTRYDVVGETMDDSGTLWYQVDVNGQSGYLRSDTVEVVEEASASNEDNNEEGEAQEASDENTTTISSVVSSRVLPEGSKLEEMSIDLATLESWESGNYYVLYTKSTNDESDPGEWYLYSIEDNQFQRIATLDADTDAAPAKKKLPSFKGNKRLIFIIGGVLLVVVILGIIFLILRRRDSGMYEEMDGYDDDDDEDEEEYHVPVKRGARGGSRKDPAPRNFLSRSKDSDMYEDDEDEDDEEEYTPRRGRRIVAPGREEPRRGGNASRSSARGKSRMYDEDDDEEEYMDDDDFEFEFLNDK